MKCPNCHGVGHFLEWSPLGCSFNATLCDVCKGSGEENEEK